MRVVIRSISSELLSAIQKLRCFAWIIDYEIINIVIVDDVRYISLCSLLRGHLLLHLSARAVLLLVTFETRFIVCVCNRFILHHVRTVLVLRQIITHWFSTFVFFEHRRLR